MRWSGWRGGWSGLGGTHYTMPPTPPTHACHHHTHIHTHDLSHTRTRARTHTSTHARTCARVHTRTHFYLTSQCKALSSSTPTPTTIQRKGQRHISPRRPLSSKTTSRIATGYPLLTLATHVRSVPRARCLLRKDWTSTTWRTRYSACFQGIHVDGRPSGFLSYRGGTHDHSPWRPKELHMSASAWTGLSGHRSMWKTHGLTPNRCASTSCSLSPCQRVAVPKSTKSHQVAGLVCFELRLHRVQKSVSVIVYKVPQTPLQVSTGGFIMDTSVFWAPLTCS